MNRVKRIYSDGKSVVLICPRINKCKGFCDTCERYLTKYDIVICLNPNYYSQFVKNRKT